MESTNPEEQQNSKPTDAPVSQKAVITQKNSSNLNRRRSLLSKKRRLETGQLRLSDTQLYEFILDDLIEHDLIGQGSMGAIYKMEHKMSGAIMAVKRIYLDENYQNPKAVLGELNIFMRENICPHLIEYYGALCKDGDCWICMELMNTSLDHFYKFVYDKMNQFIPENILAYITLVILETLDYMKSRWRIIHRNVKPSNILMSRTTIKLCNFGIIDQIIDSVQYNRYVSNMTTYLSPERILNANEVDDCNVSSSIWSLGLIIHEISVGYYPFRKYTSTFSLMIRIVDESPLKLTIDRLSDHCKNFVDSCLIKDAKQRPTYEQLLEHPFLEQAKQLEQTEYVTDYLSNIIDHLQENTDTLQ